MLSAESQQQCFADDQLGDYERRDRGSREPRAGRGAEATPSGNWDRERENENYVCDITMMRIEDGEDDGDDVGFHSHTNNVESSNNSDDPTNNNHAPDFDQVSLSSSDSGRSPSSDFSSDADSDGGGPEHRFLDELAVDRREEEATITELVRASGDGQLMDSSQSNRMRVAFGILLRLMLPLANGVARSIQGIRDVRFLRALKNLATSRQALTNVIAFAANTISMGLSSVQVTHRIEPLLKLMKIGRPRDGLESLPDIPSPAQGGPPGPASAPSTPTTPPSYSPFVRAPRGSLPRYSPGKRRAHEPPAPKCCTLDVLAEPPPGTPVRADVVFIHGLHGSLVNTWKQGLWENERRPVEFERPPRPPVRPPKRPRHSRSSAARPPHHQKRARFARHPAPESDDCFEGPPGEFDDNDFAYICGEPEEVHVCDGLEYSFPTFRLRMNDSSRLLQAELESILKGGRVGDEGGSPGRERERGRGQQKPGPGPEPEPPRPKPSADDPNYSRCWPGDWLPLDCPGVRVLALNYTTDQYLWRPLWKQKEPRSNLVQRAREMAELLIAQRVGYGHPIVWVGHSKGGLFVKQIIVDAWESGRPAAAPFWRSARGVFFYSVPHRGSHLASIKAPLLSRSVELIDIEKNSKYLVDLHRRFAGLYHLGHLKIEVFSFVETALTLMSVLYLRIVGVDSADPGIGDVCGIHLDHREICKPRSRECILYKELVKMINKVC